jgi:hypothetical protein
MKTLIEVMDGSGAWQDITSAVQHVESSTGLNAPGGAWPGVGRCLVVLDNTDKSYSPDVDGATTKLLECRRRLRARIASDSAGNTLQTIHSGAAQAAYFSQTVNVSLSPGDTLTLTWYARAQFDSQYNTDTVQIVTSAESGTMTNFTYTNKWVQYSLALVVAMSATNATPKFLANFVASGLNSQAIEYRNISLSKNGGANLLTNGDFASGSISPWAATNGSGFAVTAASYLAENYDTDMALAGGGYPGETITPSSSSTRSDLIGTDSGGNNYRLLQSVRALAGGQLTQFTFRLNANYGSPSGTMTWEIRTWTSDTAAPGGILATGALTPTPSATNTVNLSNGPVFDPGQHFWLLLRQTVIQASGNGWMWDETTANTYTDGTGNPYYINGSFNDGTVFLPTQFDYVCSFTLSPYVIASKDKIAQGFVNNNVSLTATKVSLYLKKVGFPAGTLTVRVETDDGTGKPSGTLVNANATATAAESSLSTSYAMIDFTFASSWTLPQGSAQYHIVLLTSRSPDASNYIVWGIDSSDPAYNGGEARALISGVWQTLSADAIFLISGTATSAAALSIIPNYNIQFNGLIEEIVPDAALYGPRTVTVKANSGVDRLRRTMVTLPLQKNRRADQMLADLYALLPSGTLQTTPVGKLFDTGISIFSCAFDGYDKTTTTVLDAIRDTAISEYGRVWEDKDGTLRFGARDFMARQQTTAPAKLAVSDGMPVQLEVGRRASRLVNRVELTYHPRQTVIGPTVVGQIQNYVVVPPRAADGTPGTLDVTLLFRDSAGKIIGGDNLITNLVPYTDILVYEFLPANGDYLAYPGILTWQVTTVTASQAVVRLTNRATGQLFVTKLQIRGDAIYSYDPVTLSAQDDASLAEDSLAAYTKDLPFTDDPNFCQSLANYLVDTYHDPVLEVTSVTAAYKDTLGSANLMDIEMMDVIAISAAQIGMNNIKHLVTGIAWVIDAPAGNTMAELRLTTERLNNKTYWLLGDTTYGKLGSTTRLFI